MNVEAFAPGKIILFGEHAVVHGYTAVAAAISIGSKCLISDSPNNNIMLNFKDYQAEFALSEQKLPEREKFRQFIHILEKFMAEKPGLVHNVSIELHSDLWQGAGLGSSASVSSAFLKALDKFYQLDYSGYQINELVYEMETFVHGTPSGIDNTTINTGGVLSYCQGNYTVHKKKMPLPILIIDSGERHNTKEAIQLVNAQLGKEPVKVKSVFENIDQIAQAGINAINSNDWEQLGFLMYSNHRFLQDLNLSTPKIELIMRYTHIPGVFGAKLTGAGKGGAVIAIGTTPGLYQLRRILARAGIRSFNAAIYNN